MRKENNNLRHLRNSYIKHIHSNIKNDYIIERGITLPQVVDEFRIKYIEALEKEGLNPERTILFGGCIRDLILGGEIKDYDMVSGYPRDKLMKALDKAGIGYSKGGKHDEDHIYIRIKNGDRDELLQIGEKANVVADYSINGFVCNFVTMKIELCEECVKDIEEHRLRLLKDDDPKCFRRGLYMIYKYPFLKFTDKSIKKLKKFELDETTTLSFIKRKNIDKGKFYEIAKSCDLHKQVSFLKK